MIQFIQEADIVLTTGRWPYSLDALPQSYPGLGKDHESADAGSALLPSRLDLASLRAPSSPDLKAAWFVVGPAYESLSSVWFLRSKLKLRGDFGILYLCTFDRPPHRPFFKPILKPTFTLWLSNQLETRFYVLCLVSAPSDLLLLLSFHFLFDSVSVSQLSYPQGMLCAPHLSIQYPYPVLYTCRRWCGCGCIPEAYS